MTSDWLDSALKRIPLETVLLGLAVGIITALVYEPLAGGLVLAGSALSAVGFLSLKSFVDKYLQPERARLWRRAILFYSLRLLLICLVFLIIIFTFKGRVLALAAGLSLILLSILVEAVRNLASIKQWKV
ncbi:MAG: hypothetical protein ACUVRL_01645 [Candidatus Saccharicenans sp.]|uniref:hypothetical protein n=1 Tax=Candidatus Saccharicenans sp. TaxID=2819258 RepID=UPI004049DA26